MRLPYDPLKDFTPVAMLATSDAVVAMHPKVPVRTIQELVAYAKANPGKLRFSSAGNGTITQMTGEIFAHAAGIQLEHVPYRGSAPAFTALLAGDVELHFDPAATPAVKDGGSSASPPRGRRAARNCRTCPPCASWGCSAKAGPASSAWPARPGCRRRSAPA